AERHAAHPTAMPLEHESHVTTGHLPDARRAVDTATRDTPPVRTDRDTPDGARVAFQSRKGATERAVPQANRTVESAARDNGASVAHRNTQRRGGVTFQHPRRQ